MNNVHSTWFLCVPIVSAAVFLTGCQPSDEAVVEAGKMVAQLKVETKGDKPMKIEITSTAFSEGKVIPKKFTGEGDDVSPALAWKGVPEGTKELALICDDPDAPTPEPWVHWVIHKLPADLQGLPEGVPQDAELKKPAGSLQGINSWPKNDKNVGYRGPMPPPGHGTHRYYFKLYALDTALDLKPGADKKSLLDAMEDHILGEGQLMGTYERK